MKRYSFQSFLQPAWQLSPFDPFECETRCAQTRYQMSCAAHPEIASLSALITCNAMN